MPHFKGFVLNYIYLQRDILFKYAQTESSNKTFSKTISSANPTDEDDSTINFRVGTKN
tara:strand:- start:4817 stop:4990 length:174 start_codon:yes stop_codon:yes gene_type:complete